MYYNQPFLTGEDCNSQSFLREISYKVNLADLYKVVGTCYMSKAMEYCPILLKIQNKILMRDYNLKILDHQFEIGIVRVWAICNNILIYKPSVGDENSDCIHITDLKNENSTLLVKDPINDPSFNYLAYNDGILYIANQTIVYLLQCKGNLQPGELLKIELDQTSINKIVPGLPIHGLLVSRFQVGLFYWRNLVIVAMETEDNQIDFSQIIPQNLGTSEFTYLLKQQRELVQRDSRYNDPVQKFTYMVDDKNAFFGIALRKSGYFDIYWNMTLVDSPTDNPAMDVACSFDTLYFKLDNGIVKAIETIAGPSVNFEQSNDEDDEFEFPIIFYQNIKNHVHGQFVSLYNIQESQWLKHCKFQEGSIECLVKKVTLGKDSRPKHEIAILLKNGSIYNNMQRVIFTHNYGEKITQARLLVIDESHRTFKVTGDIVRTVQDQQKNQWFYIMTKEQVQNSHNEDFQIRVYTLHYDDIFEINQGLVSEIDEFTNLAHVFYSNEQSYIVLQKDTDVFLYKIMKGKPQLTVEEEETHLKSLVPDICIVQFVNHMKIEIEGNVHSCISLNIDDHIFFVDKHHFYRYQCTTKSTKIYRDQNCVGISAVDDKFCYTLSHHSAERRSGLLLYDINNILKKDNDVSYRLSNMQVGYSGLLDWNQDYSRFSILKSLDTLVILPALHRNTIAFIGMSKREQYLATKLIKDKFIALDKNNYIFQWSVVTGKLLTVTKLPIRQDYSKFDIFKSVEEKEDSNPYKRNWFQKVLLMRQEPELNFDERNFFGEEGSNPQIKRQMQFLQTQKKEFREFRLIEILNENEVKEHLVFVHPYYYQEKQRIYFDTKNEFMLEKLQHPRVTLYEREDSKLRRQMRWRCVKRFNKFPEDLENDSGFLRVLSPSFQYCIDIDRVRNQFVIKDTFSFIEMYRIPQHLMNLRDESPKLIMNRFKWVSDEVIQIISREGTEVIIDMQDNYKEIEYNIIPLFDVEEIKDPLRNFYNNRSSLAVSQVRDRLIRKYQKYKAAYYLEHKREPYSLYEELFTVDYQVDNCKGMFVADMSFTFLHWQIMEQLENDNLSIEFIDDSQIELLCYNILPGGDTVLHKLHQNSDAITKIFELAHPNEEDVSEIAIHIPFLQNLQHKSPMHTCMEQQDIRTIDTMLTYLSGYGLDHHSRALADIIPFMVEKQLPSLLFYLESRLCQTETLSKINKGCLKIGGLGISETNLCFGQEEFDNIFIEKRKPGQEQQIERPIKMDFVDVCNLYHYADPSFYEFFNQLAGTDQYEIFETKAVQKIIEFNYPLVKEWTIRKLLVPFVFFQITLFVYLNFVFGLDTPIANILDYPMQIALGMFSIYFLHNEYLQVYHDGLDYFKSVWNYIDIITPTTILTVLSVNTFQIHIGQEAERILQAIGVFFMWYKFLYFFRLSKSFGYLTRLIILVTFDMRHFLIVLFFTIVAFGDTFLTISNGNIDGIHMPFVYGFTDSIIYTYLLILGSFDLAQFQQSIAAQLLVGAFIVCTVFNTIVMLNLLIAIISETFSMVKENAENASFQEMAALISENSYLIPDYRKESYAAKNKYLMVITDLEAEMAGNQDQVISRLEMIKRHVLVKIDTLNIALSQIKKLDKGTEKYVKKQKRYFQRVIAMIETIPGAQEALEEQAQQDAETRSFMNMIGRATLKTFATGSGTGVNYYMNKLDEASKRFHSDK